MKSIIRQAAMFLSHKENMTYDTGYDGCTVVNSERQLWSIASYMSIVYRILFGIELTEEGMHFTPYIPDWVGSEIELQNFKYRDAVVNIKVKGKGSKIKSLFVNGKRQDESYFLPVYSTGTYHIEILLEDENPDKMNINLVKTDPEHCWSPLEPIVRLDENLNLHWTMQPGIKYHLAGNNTVVRDIRAPYNMNKARSGYYSICAVDSRGVESDWSNPVLITSYQKKYEAEDFADPVFVKNVSQGYSGTGYVCDRSANCANLSIEFDIPETGDYYLTFVGSNGNGPDKTFCTIRSLFLDGKDYGTIILGASGNWKCWTQSNHILLSGITAGKHSLTLKFNPEKKGFDNNMSFNKENINDWQIDYLRIFKMD